MLHFVLLVFEASLNILLNIVLYFWPPIVPFDKLHHSLLSWVFYIHWIMVFLKYLLLDLLVIWYVDSSFYIDNSIFFLWLSIFLFQFSLYFLFFCPISLYFFQYSSFFYHLVFLYYLYLCCYLPSWLYFILKHLYVLVVFCGVNVILP